MRNAVDAMQNRGEISFKILKKENKIIILIKDTGPGIDSSKIGKIFDPGYTTKKTRMGHWIIFSQTHCGGVSQREHLCRFFGQRKRNAVLY